MFANKKEMMDYSINVKIKKPINLTRQRLMKKLHF